MERAFFQLSAGGTRVKCTLCPQNCLVDDGHRGICGVRINNSGTLFTEVYGFPAALNTDPVEKKPLYHYFPGRKVYSLGTVGCNLKCSFCQNYQISQATGAEISGSYSASPEEIASQAAKIPGNIGLAYTYNEPVVFYEYMTDIAREIHNAGLKNIMVTNGFINREPLLHLFDHIDAFNIDLKSFEDSFYRHHTRSRLSPVLDTIKEVHQSGKHLELTFLLIPGLNDEPDQFERMLDWIVTETGKSTVLHISRYFPRYKMDTYATPLSDAERFYRRAKQKLEYVYTGNMPESEMQDTDCPDCGRSILKRSGYQTVNIGMDSSGKCTGCGREIIRYL